MQMLAELGIWLRADVLGEVEGTLLTLKTKGVKPFTPRKRAAPSRTAAGVALLPESGA